PERTRSKFERAVHPPNDSACKQIVRGPLDQFRIAEFITRLAIFARQLRKRRSVYGRSPKRMVRDLTIRIAEVNPVGIQSGAERAAGITGRRRNEWPFETRVSEDPCIGDSVQGHATAHAQI